SGRAPMPTANLVYIYGVEQQTPTPAPLDELAPTKLLIPPQFINRIAVDKGVLREHRPPAPRARRPARRALLLGRDAQGLPRPARSFPCRAVRAVRLPGAWQLPPNRRPDQRRARHRPRSGIAGALGGHSGTLAQASAKPGEA